MLRPGGWRQNMSATVNNQSVSSPSSSMNIPDRVKNALSNVISTTNQSVNSSSTQSSGQNATSTTSPNHAPISPVKLNRRGGKKKTPAVSNCSNIQDYTTVTLSNNVVVKNRFKHTRPLLTSHSNNQDAKKLRTGLEQINENYDENGKSVVSDSAAVENPTITSNNTKPAVSTTNSSDRVASKGPVNASENNTPLGMQILANRPSTPTQVRSLPCPACQAGSVTKYIGNNLFKCFTCGKTYISVHRINVQQTAISTCSFYAAPSTPLTTMVSSNGVSPSSATQLLGKKRAASNRSPARSKKKKTIETVDLVSSDEEEKSTNNVVSSSTTQSSQLVQTTATTISQVKSAPSSIISRMRLPDGALPARVNVGTPPPTQGPVLPLPQARQPSSPLPMLPKTPTPPPPQGEYKFRCNKAMFGELHGVSLAPTRVADNRMYLSLECMIKRDNQAINEKYTLSVGQNDVQQIMIYFGRVPSFVAIETATRFAEVACQRIGSDVLVPSSDDPKKRYIILALFSAFKYDTEAAVEISNLLQCVSPWARIKMLSLEEATIMISKANLDVSQKELCYGSQLKPAGPVETLLIYPSPPKKGGIPVTNEDVACLADGTYLNDIIIDFYLKYLYEEVLTQAQRDKTYIFNSYFYKRLTQKSSKATPTQMHAAVKKWTRNVDIFDKDFIVIPVNEHCHWYLLVICYPGHSMNSNVEELNEKDEEESEDEVADFIKETKSTAPENQSDTESNTSIVTSNSELAQNTVKKDQISSESANPKLDTKLNVKPNSPPSQTEIQKKNNDENMKKLAGEAESSSDLLSKTESNADNKTSNTTTENKLAEAALKEKVTYQQAFETDEFNRPCILIFDSLVGSGHSKVFTNMRHYLTQEWSSRKPNLQSRVFDKTNLKGCYPKIPRQNNDCDCGVFLLQYVESFFTKRIINFRIPVHLEAWFTLEHVAGKREQIKDLITHLAADYKLNRQG